MKKEVDLLIVDSIKGKIGSNEGLKVFIEICNRATVVETDFIERISETFILPNDTERERMEVRDFLLKNNLKLFSITFKSGQKTCNCLMPKNKPLISFFDETEKESK